MLSSNVLSQVFIVKCYSKSLLLCILKRDNQLHFFRRLEKCSKRLTKCQGAIEFLRLCLNFGVTPTFAQVEPRKARKWKKSSEITKRMSWRKNWDPNSANSNVLKMKFKTPTKISGRSALFFALSPSRECWTLFATTSTTKCRNAMPTSSRA